MNSIKHVSWLRHSSWKRLSYEIVAQQSTVATTEENSRVEIKIPPRIERGPTDILQAISDTIPKDNGSFGYKYVDDRFFRPTYSQQKINFAIARESGQKAAKWIHETHYELFPPTKDDPKVAALDIVRLSNENAEEVLLQKISECDIGSAISCYEQYKENISIKAKLSFFELLCFHGGNVTDDELWLAEYRHFTSQSTRMNFVEQPILDELFTLLTEENSVTAAAAYNARIAGLAKYYKGETAFSLLEECKAKSIPISIFTYNELLNNPFSLGTSVSARRDKFMSILSLMLKDSVKPNVRTLNGCLQAVGFFLPDAVLHEVTKKIVKWFHQRGVKPSLATYSYMILSGALSNKEGEAYVASVLAVVAAQKLEIQDPNDGKFFTTVMDICANDLNSVSLARTLNNIFSSNNYNIFLTPAAAGVKYYTAFFSVMSKNLPILEFYDFYQKHVPYKYIPTTNYYEVLLKDITKVPLADGLECLPRFLTDYRMYTNKYNVEVIRLIIFYATLGCSRCESSELREQCAIALWDLYLDSGMSKRELELADIPVCLFDLIMIQLYANRTKEALRLIEELQQHASNRLMDAERIQKVYNLCLSMKLYQHVTQLIEYMLAVGYPDVRDYGKKLYQELPANAPERDQLTSLMGFTNLM